MGSKVIGNVLKTCETVCKEMHANCESNKNEKKKPKTKCQKKKLQKISEKKKNQQKKEETVIEEKEDTTPLLETIEEKPDTTIPKMTIFANPFEKYMAEIEESKIQEERVRLLKEEND